MLHKIKIRKVAVSDFSSSCPFPNTDEDEFQLKVRSLIEDINNLDDVISAVRNGAYIDVESSLDRDRLLKKVETYFIGYGNHLRYTE